MCGGTCPTTAKTRHGSGLSPRVRGNHMATTVRNPKLRSIPACAGEPYPGTLPQPRAQVYPRVCGGTSDRYWVYPIGTGLSPRVRGNPVAVLDAVDNGGSIPACAGEPWWPTFGLGLARSIPACAGEPIWRPCSNSKKSVYPRVCGGTGVGKGEGVEYGGLSPRVRGNQVDPTKDLANIGSIPACAGEPQSFPAFRLVTGVYPRVCGGTVPPPTMF